MNDGSDLVARRPDTPMSVPARPTIQLASAACAWALAFGAVSFFWAAGGQLGAATLGVRLEQLGAERDPGFVALLWATGALKVLGGLLALALVRRWGQALPRRALLVAIWSIGALITLYGCANLVQHVLMASGAISTPAGLGSDALPWHLALWDPVWVIGGLLFLGAARQGSVARQRFARRA